MQRALDFLKNHVEIAFATSEGNRPHIRIFQIMKMEGSTLFFATSPEKEVYRQLLENPLVEMQLFQLAIGFIFGMLIDLNMLLTEWMVVWFFATTLAKQWDATIPYIEQNRLAPWTQQQDHPESHRELQNMAIKNATEAMAKTRKEFHQKPQ